MFCLNFLHRFVIYWILSWHRAEEMNQMVNLSFYDLLIAKKTVHFSWIQNVSEKIIKLILYQASQRIKE